MPYWYHLAMNWEPLLMADNKPKTDEDWLAKEFEAKQYFTPAAPIDEYQLFAGRHEQIGALIDAVAERGRHAVLYGERGIGKTSLTNTFWAVLGASKVANVTRIRIQCDPSDDFTSIWKKLFREVRLIEENPDGTETSATLDRAYPDAVLPDDVRRELAVFGTNAIPVIILDEFDKIKDQDTLSLMANTIKYLSDYAVNVTLIIVGVADGVAELLGEHESIKRCLTQIQMPRMSTDELREIIDKRLPRLGMKITGDARWKIVTLARGLPSYVHALSRFAVVRAIKAKRLTITEDDVAAAIDDLLGQTDLSCRDDYLKATTSNQSGNLYRQVLLACALAETKTADGYFSAVNVVQPLCSILGRTVEIANFKNHLAAFAAVERGQILTRRGKTRQHQYRFHDPLMQPYVIMRGIKEKMVSESAKEVMSFPEQTDLFATE